MQRHFNHCLITMWDYSLHNHLFICDWRSETLTLVIKEISVQKRERVLLICSFSHTALYFIKCQLVFYGCSYSFQDCIYLTQNTVQLWNIITILNNCFMFEYIEYKGHLFLWSKLNFQHHYSSLQCHMIFRNHSDMLICCSRIILYYFQC